MTTGERWFAWFLMRSHRAHSERALPAYWTTEMNPSVWLEVEA